MHKWFYYLKEIEKQSASGEIALKLGAWHLQKNEWGKALHFIKLGIAKGNLKNLAKARELLAECYRLMGREDLAMTISKRGFCV